MTGSSQRRRSSTTTSRNENHRPRQTQQEQSRDGERVWKVRGRPRGLVEEGHVSNVTHASLTFLRNFHARGARLLGRRAVRRDTRLDSVRLRHRRLSSSVSRSQGRSQEASLAPRPTSCSPTTTRLLVALAPITDLSRLTTLASRQLRESCFFFGLRFFWLSLLRVFLLCYSSSVGTLYRSRARVEYLARREEILEISKQKFPSREHSW